MFFKYDKLLYYFTGNLVFKREGKGQQKKKKKKRTGVEYLAAARAKSLANPKFCKFAIHTPRLP